MKVEKMKEVVSIGKMIISVRTIDEGEDQELWRIDKVGISEFMRIGNLEIHKLQKPKWPNMEYNNRLKGTIDNSNTSHPIRVWKI